MVNRKYILGFTILVLIFGFLTNVVGIKNDPSGYQGEVNSNSGEAKVFSINIIDNATPNNTVKWYINGTQNGSTQTDKPSSTKTLTESAGNYNVTVISTNASNSSDSDSTRWLWVVTAAAPDNTAPIVTSDPTEVPLDTSANISVSVNQSNAHIKILYGTSSSSLDGIKWDNGSGSPRVISIPNLAYYPPLSPGTKYYYNVTAVNSSNSSLRSNTSTFSFTTVEPTAPNATNVEIDEPTTSKVNVSFDVNQTNAITQVKYGLNESLSQHTTNETYDGKIMLSSLEPGTKYFYSVYAYNKTNTTLFDSTAIRNFMTKSPGPTMTQDPPESPAITITVGQSINLTVIIGTQGGTLEWYINDDSVKNQTVGSGDHVNYTFKKNTKGTYNITANISNGNGSDTAKFTINNRIASYSTGNRIWDGDRNPDDFSKTYTWTPQSFSGFYYDPAAGIGTENIEIELTGRSDRTIEKNNIIYSTEPQEVKFEHGSWGYYQVIGFMADKYFAGYKNHTIDKASESFDDVSAIAQGQLHKVLYDDDTKRSISVGSTLALKNGYVLKATDIDMNGRTMALVLLKDGAEVDSSFLREDETYVYMKRVGGVDELPLILVRFANVFAGAEFQAAQIKGIFQISEDVTQVKSGNKFGVMEVTEVNKDKIVMKNNDADVGLNRGSVVDLMGNLKIVVADHDDLRFALSVDRKGSFEVRSTVFDEDTNKIKEWTPYNFGMNIGKTVIGFYYNLDDGLGNEMLEMTDRDGTSIPENKLVYTTKPEEVLFARDDWGRYQVIGFMADKYFAGYKGHTIKNSVEDFGDTSAMAQGQLHKVLIDDDTKRRIDVGGTIALQDGYALKATDIDMNGRTMALVLLKDGEEVDSNFLRAGETYVYMKRVGSVDELPLILVRFDNVFAGAEFQAAQIKGIFQIKETPTNVKNGDSFGEMEVTTVNDEQIVMKNSGDIGLDRNSENPLMGNIKIKVADSDILRFYFKVDVTEDMIADQLAIDVPSKVMAGDNLNVKITAGGKAVDNASLTLETDTDMGTTDRNGVLNYTIPKTLKNGTYTITATKTGFEKATKNIEIEKYIDLRLSIEAPSNANQYETIIIKVLYNGTAMSGASVLFDNASIGTSDSNGEVNYRLETSGTHSITASKSSYVTVSRDIDIRAPYSEFKANDISIVPNPVFAGYEFVVRSNITNAGTKADTLPVELVINGSAVENRTITLAPGEISEINFTRSEEMVANVTVEILGQSNLLVVQEKPFSYLWIAAIVTGIGAVAIYVLTSKGLLSLELLKQKFALLSQKFNLLFRK